MHFQLRRVQTYTDFRVWCNNYGILATNTNLVTVPHSGAVTVETRTLIMYSSIVHVLETVTITPN